jgi:hypothetical protein
MTKSLDLRDELDAFGNLQIPPFSKGGKGDYLFHLPANMQGFRYSDFEIEG